MCEECEREDIESFDAFSEPHDLIFKAYIDDVRELVRDEDGNLPQWWESWERRQSDEHAQFVMDKFNQSLG